MQAARDEAVLLAGPDAQMRGTDLWKLRNFLLKRFAERIKDIAMN